MAVGIVACLWVLAAGQLSAAETGAGINDTWVATDGLGREVATHAKAGAPRSERTVGIFYFLWLGVHGYDRLDDPGRDFDDDQGVQPKERPEHRYRSPYVLTDILRENPHEPGYGPIPSWHFTGESQFGFYLSDDRYVFRKHLAQLGNAGVDVLLIDVTNAYTYRANYLALLEEMERMEALGSPVPDIAFVVNTKSTETVERLYREFYANGLHRDRWFQWEGKPLILAPPEGHSPEIADFFTFRRSWAFTHVNPAAANVGWFEDGQHKWPWIDLYPQGYGWDEDPAKAEAMAVAPASHPLNNVGRSHDGERQPTPGERATSQGVYFGKQWERALAVDPEFIFLTGWNEWVATTQVHGKPHRPPAMMGEPLEEGDVYFVDKYNSEFSRDIEPSREPPLADHYYYQMIDGIRRFKGVPPIPAAGEPVAVEVDGAFGEWGRAAPVFRDHRGDTRHRDHPGWGSAGPYVNRLGRNDIVEARVARDAETIAFYARTDGPLTAPETGWMQLYIDSDGDPTTGWEGYDVLVAPDGSPDGAARLLHWSPEAGWTEQGRVPLAFAGNEVELAVPRALLPGLDLRGAHLDFKWVDNPFADDSARDFTHAGDAAPDDRFNFRYQLEK